MKKHTDKKSRIIATVAVAFLGITMVSGIAGNAAEKQKASKAQEMMAEAGIEVPATVALAYVEAYCDVLNKGVKPEFVGNGTRSDQTILWVSTRLECKDHKSSVDEFIAGS